MRFRALLTSLFLVCTFVWAAAAQQMAERVQAEYARPGVVLLALGDGGRVNPLLRELIGESASALLRIQTEIAIKAAKYNTVVVLAPDDESKLHFLEDCDDHPGLCDALDAGSIVVQVVPHQTPWIRDYGPLFRTTAHGGIMVDARYHDHRFDVSKREYLADINRQRLTLLAQVNPEGTAAFVRALRRSAAVGGPGEDRAADQSDVTLPPAPEDDAEPENTAAELVDEGESAEVQADDNDVTPATPTGDEDLSDEQMRALVRAISGDGDEEDVMQKLQYLHELYDAIEKYDAARALDDESPASVLLTLFTDPDMPTERLDLDLDGGNILPMPDGQCITTRGLLARNVSSKIGVRQLLEKHYGCRVVYLDPLPGGVIEHVDMFVLPAGDNRVFVASYDPSNPILRPYWAELSASMKRIVVEAAVTMENNAAALRKAGYTVIEVPSPFPRAIEDGVYYPTVLNGLVQMGVNKKMQFLLPRYADYQTDVQEKAFDLIRSTLGPQADVDTVEATAAAIGQGAVHCLTLVVPREWTHFGDDSYAMILRRIATAAQSLDVTSVAGRSGALEGTWHVESDHDSDAETELTVVFRQQKMRLKIGEATRLSAAYDVIERQGHRWKLKLDDDSMMQVAWNDPNSIELFGDQDKPLLKLVRK